MLEGKKPLIFLRFEVRRWMTGSIGLVIRLLSQLCAVQRLGMLSASHRLTVV